jgi:putative AlgH/UPF0301 family transcriptional regulator
MEPSDMNFICEHEKAGAFGKYIHRGPIEECGPSRVLFEQHPFRHPDGSPDSNLVAEWIGSDTEDQ